MVMDMSLNSNVSFTLSGQYCSHFFCEIKEYTVQLTCTMHFDSYFICINGQFILRIIYTRDVHTPSCPASFEYWMDMQSWRQADI